MPLRISSFIRKSKNGLQLFFLAYRILKFAYKEAISNREYERIEAYALRFYNTLNPCCVA